MSRLGRASVAAVYAAALFVALVGLDFGHHWDEIKLLNSAAEAVRSGLLLPRWYNYPSLSFDVVGASLAPEAASLLATGEQEESRLIDEIVGSTIYSRSFRLRVRTVFASLALLAIVWTYAWSVAAGSSRWEALLAAALLACSWEVGYHARWIAPDAVLMQFAAATMAAVVWALRAPPGARPPHASTVRWLDLAAVLAGLALSTKYPGGVLLIPVLLASSQLGQGLRTQARLIALFFAAFFVASPGVALEPGRFLEDVAFEIAHYRRGHGGYSVAAGVEHGRLLLGYLSTELLAPWQAPALALFALALLGAIHLVREHRRTAAVVLCVPVLYFLYMSTQRVMIVRNYLLIAPFLAVLAARGAAVLVATARPRVLRLGLAATLAALVAASMAWQLRAAGSVDGREAIERANEITAYLSSHPERRFALSAAARRIMNARADAPNANVAGDVESADAYIFESSEVADWTRWIANRDGTYQVVSGPREVNFDYYPTWAGPPRVLAVSMDVARRMKVVEPSGIEPPTS